MATISVEKNTLIPLLISDELFNSLSASAQTFLEELDANQDGYIDINEQKLFLQKTLGPLSLSSPHLWKKQKSAAIKLLSSLYRECNFLSHDESLHEESITFKLSWAEHTQVFSFLSYYMREGSETTLVSFLEFLPQQTAVYLSKNPSFAEQKVDKLGRVFSRISLESAEVFLKTLCTNYDGAELSTQLVSCLPPQKLIELFYRIHPALAAQIIFHLQRGEKKHQELASYLLDQRNWNTLLTKNADNLIKTELIAKHLIAIDSFLDLFFDVQDVKKNVAVLPTIHSATLSALSSWKPHKNDKDILQLLNDAKFFPEFSGAEIVKSELEEINRIKIYVERTIQLPPKEVKQNKASSFFSDEFISSASLTERTYFDLKPQMIPGETLAENSLGVLSFAINSQTGNSYFLFSDDIRTVEFELESGKALLFERGEQMPTLMLDFRNPQNSFGYGPTYNIGRVVEDLKETYYEMLKNIEEKSLRFRYTGFFKQAL